MSLAVFADFSQLPRFVMLLAGIFFRSARAQGVFWMAFKQGACAILLACLLAGGAVAETPPQETPWIELFNGENLDGWTPKIRGQELGEDKLETFRVEDGLLTVSFENYDSFDGQFGHLFYEESFSHYRLKVEYRFIGEQCEGGPSWAFRNNGLMIHGQDPATMTLNQEFPVSIEVQLLGGDGTNDRSTANMCSPGTHVVIDGKLERRHCVESGSKTIHGDEWVTVEVEVRGNEVIRHFVDGEQVMEYTQPQLDDKDRDGARLIDMGKEVMISSGTISVQSESHPTQFRKISLQVLEE